MINQLLTALLIAGLSATAKAEPEIWACHGQLVTIKKGKTYRDTPFMADSSLNPSRIKSFQLLVDRANLTVKARGDASFTLDNTGDNTADNLRSLSFFDDGTGWEGKRRTTTVYFKDKSLIWARVHNISTTETMFADCDKF